MSLFSAVVEYEELSEQSKAVAIFMFGVLTKVQGISLEEIKAEMDKFIDIMETHYPEDVLKAMCFASIFADNMIQTVLGAAVKLGVEKYKG